MMMRFREMSKEVEALTTSIFDDGVIKFVSSYTDHNDEHVMLVEWINLDPGLLFAIREENRSDFWARVKKMVESRTTTPPCWKYFGKLAIEHDPKEEWDKDIEMKGDYMIGFELELNGSTCWHGLPTPRKYKLENDKVEHCAMCLMLNHSARTCTEIPFHKQRKRKNRSKEKKGKKSPNQGCCWFCGDWGHEQSRCPKTIPYCVRCKSHSHSSAPTPQCPLVRQQAAYNRRKMLLTTIMQRMICRSELQCYAIWHNRQNKENPIRLKSKKRPVLSKWPAEATGNLSSYKKKKKKTNQPLQIGPTEGPTLDDVVSENKNDGDADMGNVEWSIPDDI